MGQEPEIIQKKTWSFKEGMQADSWRSMSQKLDVMQYFQKSKEIQCSGTSRVQKSIQLYSLPLSLVGKGTSANHGWHASFGPAKQAFPGATLGKLPGKAFRRLLQKAFTKGA